MVPTSANATSGQPLGSSRSGAMPLKFYWARCKLAQSWWIWVCSCESFCQRHLAPASVPVAMVLATIYLYYVPWHMRKPLGWITGINSVLVWWELHPELRLSSTSLPRNEPSCSRRWKIEVKAIYTEFPRSIARTFKWRWSIDRQNVNLQQVSWHYCKSVGSMVDVAPCTDLMAKRFQPGEGDLLHVHYTSCMEAK